MSSDDQGAERRSPYGPAGGWMPAAGAPQGAVEPQGAAAQLPGYQPPPGTFLPGPQDPTRSTEVWAAGNAPSWNPAPVQQPGYPPVPVPYGTPVPPYAGQSYAMPGGYPQIWAPPPPYDGLAIASISTSGAAILLAFLTPFFLLAAPVGLALGIWSLVRVRRTGAQGKALAITGLVLGGLGTLAILALVALLGLVLWAFSTGF